MASNFFVRLYHIPLVSTAVDHVESLYSRSKQQHPIIRFACEAAEYSIQVAAVSAQPVFERLEQPIDRINRIACNQLDRLQTSYPVINMPTELLIDKVKKSVADIFKVLTADSFYQNSDLTNNVELDVQKPDDADSTRSVILTWRLSPSTKFTWFLPSPFVLFSVADKMALAVEHCLGHFLNDQGCSKESQFVMMDVACTFYSQAVKQLSCQAGTVDKFIRSHDVMDRLGNILNYQYVQGFIVVLLDWLVSHSPLVFLMPDFSSSGLQAGDVDDGDVDDGGIMEDAMIGGVIGFVPLNPADLAALPLIRPQRMYWKRRY